jgi:predicted NACHT family NTPase
VFRVAGGPHTIEAVYVEVTLDADAPQTLSRKVSGKFSDGVDDLHGRVSLTRLLSQRHRRWGLLGAPGSGKTTLLRHVAIELLSKPDSPLPISLKVAELEHGLEEAIKALCTSFNAPDLADYLLNEAKDGRAALLIDGLDEAIDVSAARKWVAGAAAEVGDSTIIVASREIGYTAPTADFYTVVICPLDAAWQTELLSRWVQDSTRASVAIERLSRVPSLRRFAENPLLLTLVGLLLRAGQDVPMRRGDLYERALKLFLTRDHDAEDTGPVAPMREPDLTLQLLGWAALALHGLEGEAYRRDPSDPRNAEQLGRAPFLKSPSARALTCGPPTASRTAPFAGRPRP